MRDNEGRLDKYLRSPGQAAMLAEEEALAHVALELAEMLERAGVTQRELAERIGVTEGRISQILCAESNPTVRTLARIGHALDQRLRVTFAAPHGAAMVFEVPPLRYHLLPDWEVTDGHEAAPEAACTEPCAA